MFSFGHPNLMLELFFELSKSENRRQEDWSNKNLA